MTLKLPQGYETRIGEGGTSLSSGQKQRIGLARAVYGNPFLVVLDEPDANLDADGERALTQTIAKLRAAGCIPIVVSHRATALATLDMALLLFNGRMVAFGPRERVFDLIAKSTGAGSPGMAVQRQPIVGSATQTPPLVLHAAG